MRLKDQILDELNVKDVGALTELGDVLTYDVKPNLPVLGPKLGPRIREVREALDRFDVEQLSEERYRVGEFELGADELIFEGLEPVEGSWVFAASDGVRVALDPTLDEELEREGRLLDLIHLVNGMRKDAGLEITDRIRLRLPGAFENLRRHLTLDLELEPLALPGGAELAEAQPGQRTGHGLPLRIEDLGLRHDVDDDASHPGVSKARRG